MKKILVIIAVLIIHAGVHHVLACTAVIISGEATPDGRPIMWKHRDTQAVDNKLLYFSKGKYEYIGMVSVGKNERKHVWMGMNEAGFCIMNTKSYNLNDDSDDEGPYGPASIMARALANCSNLEEFESMLHSLERPTGLESNFGVIDARGGAAYFEVGDDHLEKMDVNNPKIAPLGYAVMTNHSYTGRPEDGQGYARYNVANELFYQNALQNNLTVDLILKEADRSLVNGFTKVDLRTYAGDPAKRRMVHFKDNIARRSTTSSVVFKGVRPDNDPLKTMMWAITGWPLTTVAYPVWLNDEQMLPKLLTAPEEETAPICDAGLAAKKIAMPLTYGHGQDYLDINRIYNKENTGYMQWIRSLEDEILHLTRKKASEWPEGIPDDKALEELYGILDQKIIDMYSKQNMTLDKN